MVKRTVKTTTSAILLLSLCLFMCACSKKSESTNSDVIYSLYYYFKQDTNEILKLLSSDSISEHKDELKARVNEINWVTSALLTALDALPDEAIISTTDKDYAKDNITGVTTLFEENLSDLYENNDSSVLVEEFNKTLLANIKYVIDLRLQILDTVITDNLQSQNLLDIDSLKTECVYEINDYITFN